MKRVTQEFIAECAQVHVMTVRSAVAQLKQLDLSDLT